MTPDPRIAGVVIEFIGPSGTGKTTLLKSYQEQAVYKWNTDPWSVTLNRSALVPGMLDGFYKNLIHRKCMDLLQQKYPFRQISTLIAFSTLRLMQDQALMESDLLRVGGACFDDGMLHIFGKEILEELRTGQCDQGALSQFLDNRAIVNLQASASLITKRLKARASGSPGRESNWYEIYGDEGIDEFIRAWIRQNEALVSLCNSLNLLVLDLNMEQEERCVIRDLKEIEEKIVAHFQSRRRVTAKV